MRTRTLLVRALVVLGLAMWVSAPMLVAQPGFQARQLRYPRVRAAEAEASPTLRQLLQAQGIKGPFQLYLRAFKHERTLEVWAAPTDGATAGTYVRLTDYAFCASSGGLGPKRAKGDGQIPEGFYTIDRFNPSSTFHLSLGLDYPNAVDRSRAGRTDPGGDIFIHGDCVTIGCIPITDAGIRALYLLAVWARGHGQRQIPVHVFPSRPIGERWSSLLADPQTRPMYEALAAAYRDFAVSRQRSLPHYRATAKGYVRQ